MSMMNEIDGNIPKEPLATAVYIRVTEDRDADDDRQGHREALHRFVTEHPDLVLAEVYEDRDVAEVNLNRPVFARLMEDVRRGRIQCVVIWDLACFGENFRETGYYLETLFPYLNVRFFVVSKDWDSDREADREQMSAFLKEKVNEIYSKRLSLRQCESAKVRVAKQDAMPNGSAPFGYRFSEDKKQYLVDSENAFYVRLIFQWVLMGVSLKQIAKRLDLLGVMTPGQNRRRTYGKTMPKTGWRADMVYKIIRNPNYTGDICTGRMTQALYKDEKRRHTLPEEWTVRENAHQALVSREGFWRVQEIMRENRRT